MSLTASLGNLRQSRKEAYLIAILIILQIVIMFYFFYPYLFNYESSNDNTVADASKSSHNKQNAQSATKREEEDDVDFDSDSDSPAETAITSQSVNFVKLEKWLKQIEEKYFKEEQDFLQFKTYFEMPAMGTSVQQPSRRSQSVTPLELKMELEYLLQSERIYQQLTKSSQHHKPTNTIPSTPSSPSLSNTHSSLDTSAASSNEDENAASIMEQYSYIAELKSRYVEETKKNPKKLQFLKSMDKSGGLLTPYYYYFADKQKASTAAGSSKEKTDTVLFDLINFKSLMALEAQSTNSQLSSFFGTAKKSTGDLILKGEEELLALHTDVEGMRQKMLKYYSTLYERRRAAMELLHSQLVSANKKTVDSNSETAIEMPQLSKTSGHIVGKFQCFFYVLALYPSWKPLYFGFLIPISQAQPVSTMIQNALHDGKKSNSGVYMLSEDTKLSSMFTVDAYSGQRMIHTSYVVPVLHLIQKPVKLLVFMATWSSMSKLHIPPLMKLVHLAENPRIQVEFVVVDASSNAAVSEEQFLLESLHDQFGFFWKQSSQRAAAQQGLPVDDESILSEAALKAAEEPLVKQHNIRRLPTMLMLSKKKGANGGWEEVGRFEEEPLGQSFAHDVAQTALVWLYKFFTR